MLESRLIDTRAWCATAGFATRKRKRVCVYAPNVRRHKPAFALCVGRNQHMKRTSSKPYGLKALRESTARRGFNRGASEGWRARNNRKAPRLAVRSH